MTLTHVTFVHCACALFEEVDSQPYYLDTSQFKTFVKTFLAGFVTFLRKQNKKNPQANMSDYDSNPFADPEAASPFAVRKKPFSIVTFS